MARPEEWLTTGQVAGILGLSRSTITRRIDLGDIPAHRLPGGHWRIARSYAEHLRTRGAATYGDDLDRPGPTPRGWR